MNAGTGLRTMLRAIGCDEHHNRNQRLARLCHELHVETQPAYTLEVVS